MAQTTGHAAHAVGLRATIVSAALVLVGPAHAQGPRVGEVRRVRGVTLSVRAGSTEKETRRATYTPPPGWYIRSHAVNCTARCGHTSFSVSTVPQGWGLRTEEELRESYKVLIDLAGKSHGPGLQAKFALEQDALLRGLRQARATHHALVVEATAAGEGFLRGGSCIELTVTAELVYLGTNECPRLSASPSGASQKRAAPGPSR
jgi:hypothetical protein